MLDTDIASYLIKKRSRQLDEKFRHILPGSICLSVVTRAELLFGIRSLPHGHRLQLEVPYFLNAVRVLDWGSGAAGHYAEIRHALTVSGNLIGELDIMIAAHAMAAGAILVTNNTRHYSRITLPLVIENWAE